MSAPPDPGVHEPTIFAVASGAGRSAIAVLRITGSATKRVVTSLAGRVPAPRRASLATLRDPVSGEALDDALVLWFPGPQSFTGEDAAELHLHGGRAVVRGVLDALSRLEGLRPAEAGEFTRRALRHGKMDLAAVEGLADLIDAETDAQRRLARRQLDGALGRWAQGIRGMLIEALAVAEGAIDFAEDDDLMGSFQRDVGQQVWSARDRISAELLAGQHGERVREGFVVAIAGAPNVGKSTLLNVLAGREAAIVSVHAGTTRDPIEVDLDLGGYAVRLIDTAGLREASDPVEQEGIARARARATSADLVLWLHDHPIEPIRTDVTDGATIWTVATKIDAAPTAVAADFAISARSGAGVAQLLDALTDHVAAASVGAESGAVTRLRHRLSLQTAARHLDAALTVDPAHLELIAEDLRAALAALAPLTAPVDTEEVLGSIFARFCIGK